VTRGVGRLEVSETKKKSARLERKLMFAALTQAEIRIENEAVSRHGHGVFQNQNHLS
jgi:hypothetical protein